MSKLKCNYPVQSRASWKSRSGAKSRTVCCFTGKEKDAETSLDYFGARYLDKDFGMWLTPDASRQFPNLYKYSSDPLNGIDPDGNKEIRVAIYFNATAGLNDKNVPYNAIKEGARYERRWKNMLPDDHVTVKAFKASPDAVIQISSWLFSADVRAVMTHGVPGGQYFTDIPYPYKDPNGNHEVSFADFERFSAPTFMGMCYSQENIPASMQQTLLPAYNNGVVFSNKEVERYIIEHSDTRANKETKAGD